MFGHHHDSVNVPKFTLYSSEESRRTLIRFDIARKYPYTRVALINFVEHNNMELTIRYSFLGTFPENAQHLCRINQANACKLCQLNLSRCDLAKTEVAEQPNTWDSTSVAADVSLDCSGHNSGAQRHDPFVFCTEVDVHQKSLLEWVAEHEILNMRDTAEAVTNVEKVAQLFEKPSIYQPDRRSELCDCLKEASTLRLPRNDIFAKTWTAAQNLPAAVESLAATSTLKLLVRWHHVKPVPLAALDWMSVYLRIYSTVELPQHLNTTTTNSNDSELMPLLLDHQTLDKFRTTDKLLEFVQLYRCILQCNDVQAMLAQIITNENAQRQTQQAESTSPMDSEIGGHDERPQQQHYEQPPIRTSDEPMDETNGAVAAIRTRRRAIVKLQNSKHYRAVSSGVSKNKIVKK